MPFRAVGSKSPAPRQRPAPATPDLPKAQQVTLVVNACVREPDRLYQATKEVLARRGTSGEEVDRRVAANGTVDLGMCVALLMEESISALSGATGAEIDGVETYLELIPGIDVDTTPDADAA